jgi:hypothetical protein
MSMIFKVRSRKPVAGPVANEEICRAVRERRVVRCVYGDGEERVIEPHCHGHSRAGEELLSAFQPASGWKMLDVKKLSSFVVTNELFEVREDFNREQPGVTQVHCIVPD